MNYLKRVRVRTARPFVHRPNQCRTVRDSTLRAVDTDALRTSTTEGKKWIRLHRRRTVRSFGNPFRRSINSRPRFFFFFNICLFVHFWTGIHFESHSSRSASSSRFARERERTFAFVRSGVEARVDVCF